MDQKRAAAALLALAACIACSSAAPTASNQTALELMDGPSDGCYYNFQHYGEGDRIMTNEPCLNCTCHKRMLMCYLRVCPFTKAIGQDCTVEKRADQCCPIVTCPDVPVDLLTSTSTSSPAEYGTTGVGKFDKYGCSINGKYFSEGSKVPSTPNKPCEHCYCIRNMTTCVMQECTLHVDGCTPIYHKDVCCPVRYSCDHEEDETLLLDDMTTTVRPTPGFLLTTTTVMPVTQITQDCIHDYQVFPDGTLIKTEKACEHCYCMKGDIVCVVQECGTPMENEGKNCTSLPPRHGQCCPDTYICEGDDHVTELTTEIQQEKSTQPPRRVGVEGSGYRNEPDEPFTEKGTFETDIEGSGEDYATDSPVMTIEDVITEKIQPDIIDETLLSTTEKYQISHITEPDNYQNKIPDVISDTGSSDLPETIAQTTEANLELTSIDTGTDQHKTENELISKEDEYITTESLFKKDDNSIISDEMLTIKETDKLPTTMVDLVEETTFKDELLDNVSTEDISKPQEQSTTVSDKSTAEVVSIVQEKEATTDNLSLSSSTESSKPVDEVLLTTDEQLFTGLTTMAEDKTELLETTSINPGINEIDEDISIVSSPGRIPGEGDCLLNGITYKNNTTVPTSNNCHTSCKCVSSIIKCDPIICSSPPEYVENMNDCQPIYDSPDACCPTYVCSAKETIPPESHNQMSGTESPKPISGSDCNGQDCILNEVQKEISKAPSSCTSEDCLDKSADKQDEGDCGLNGCADETRKPSNQDCADDKCQILPAVACEGENCINEPVLSQDSHKKTDSDKEPSAICDENDCKTPGISQDGECKDESCKKQENAISEVNIPSDCIEPECKKHDMPISLPTEEITEQKISETAPSEDSHKIPDSDKGPSVICDDNNDCKIPESTESEVNVPLDCTEPECKKHDKPISSATEETTEQKINEPASSEDSHKIPDSDKGPSVICDDNNDCKTPQSTETEVNLPSDCTEPECKTHDMTLSTPTEEATEQNINEQGPSEDSHKIPDSDNRPSAICDENGCKTSEISHDGECKDESCKKQESTKTEVNIPSDCTEPECKTYDISLSPPTEEATEQNISEQGPSEDSHKIPDSDKGPSAICDENNDCKTPEISQHDECKDGSCIKQEGMETEVNVPTDCSESKCKTPLQPSEETTDSATENISNDIVQTDVTQSPIDTITEISEKTTKTAEIIPEVTKEVNIEPSEKLTTISDVFSDVTDAAPDSELTESPIIQSTSQKYDIKITEHTIIEHVTESLAPQEADKVTLADETATDKEIAGPAITEPQDQADKMDITTEILEETTDSNVHSTKHDEKYGTVPQLDTEKEKTPTGIPELNKNEKLSTTEATGASEKLTTVKDVTEIYEIQKEKTEVPITLGDVDTQTEKISTDYNKATETHNLPQGTIEPHDQFGETHTEKEKTETSELDETRDVITEKNTVDMAIDVTPESPVTEVNEVITDKLGVTIEPNNVPTELPQSSQTKLDQVTKDVTEIVTDNDEAYTESITPKVEDATLEPSVQSNGVPQKDQKSEVTEESITQKVTVTESSNILQTKTESSSGEFGQFVTKSEEVYAETPQQPIDKVDEISSTTTLEKNVEEPVTEKSTTQIVVSESTEKQKIYDEFTTEHEQELHTTIYEEIINKDQTISIDSRTELPTSSTISTETMKVNKDQDVRTDEPDKSVTEKGLDSSDDVIHATSKADEVQPTEVYQQITEKLEDITESTPSHEFVDDNTRRQNTIQPTSSESPDSNEKDLESVKQTTIQDIVVMPEATTIIQDHVQVIESYTKSPSQDDEKHEEPSTEVEKESPFETNVTNMETVTELLPKKPDETYITPPFDAISKGDGITENYATESPNIDTEMMGESQSHLDSSTELTTHKHVESSESSLPNEEIEISDKVTTVIPHVKENADKQPAVLTESELTSHNLEKTTASLISVDEKETEPQLHITESYDHVEEEQTVKPTSGLMIGVHDYENTEKSVSDEETLPQKTNEYSPIDGITEEVSLQTLQDVSTEKTKTKDTLETLAPDYIGPTQSELSTKSEKSGVTDSALFDKEKETATELPHSYTTIEDLDKISDSVQKDTKDENINKLPGPVENNQELTIPVYTKSDENQEITTPVSDVTDIKQITEVELPENNKVGIESTTQLFDDTNAEVEGEQTVPDLHITESQTEKSKDEITQKQESSTDKITESPDYLSTSHLQEQPTTSSVDIKTPQQATVTEKQSDQTESVSEEQPTQPELHSTEDTLASTVKEGVINIEDEKATLVPDFVQMTSHSPEYHTTGLISDDKNTIELKSTTMSSETHHEIVTDVEKSPVSIDMVTTESVITKQSETEGNEIDIVKYTQFDHISTGKPPSVTESKEYENNHEQSTEVPVSIVTHLSTEPIKVATEDQIVSVTESHAKGTETTELHYTAIAEEKESSTAPSNISDKEPEQSSKDDEKMITKEPEGIQELTTKEDSQIQLENKNVTTSVTKDIGINIETTKPTIIEKEETEQSEIYSTEHSIDKQTEKQVSQNELDKLTTESVQALPPDVNIATELPVSTRKDEEFYVTENNRQTTESHDKFSETTQFLVELEEHTHPVADEITTKSSLEDIATTVLYETREPQQPERGDQKPEDLSTHKDEYPTEHSKTTAATIEDKEQPVTQVQEQIDESTSVIPPKSETETSHITEKIPIQTSVYEPVETEKDSTKYEDNVISSPTPQKVKDTTLQDYSTESIEIHQTPSSTLSDVEISSEKDIHVSSEKPETLEEKLTPELPKETTSKISEETATSSAKPQEKPEDTTLRPVIPDVPKPEFIDEHNEELPSPDFPPSGGYGQEPDYIDEDQAFGPGTCRYGGKVYVSAQQIPRDDPCDFCFCFRSDIICLQQSCPPPIHGCHEEPIQGFCCPRYECPVSMATTLNVTTTTTTTTTTLPPHFLPHAYKGAAQRRGCQIKGHTYKVGEVVRASSGPCLHCTCGGDGQMKCDPKACTPEPMLRQMIAAAVSAKRRR